MDPKELIIINDFDKPCVRLLMENVGGNKARYINKELQNYSEFDIDNTSCTLHDFGFDVKMNVDANDYEYIKTRESVAKYPSGQTREWQDRKQFLFRDIINEVR